MPASVPPFSISIAGKGVTDAPGRVVAVYAKAAYVSTAAGLFAVTTPDVPPGPVHAATHADVSRLRAGDQVEVDLAGAHRWVGALPAQLDAELLLAVLAAAPPSSLSPLPDGDIAALAAYLGGRGPGLTPAGDDCLAGMFLVAYVRGDDVTGLAEAVPTNDIALAFLHWAAQGQSIEPVHRLLCATDHGAGREALADLLRFGHSSGADLALGLRTAVQRLCNGARHPS